MDTPNPTPDKQTSTLEQDRYLQELQVKEKQLDIQLKEADLREKERKKNPIQITPTFVSIMGAVIGLFGVLIGAWMQGATNQNLEKLKFESEIILKSASGDNIEQNKKNLKFLLDAGFISDKEGKIKKILTDSAFSLRISNDLTDFSNSEFVTLVQFQNAVRDIRDDLVNFATLGIEKAMQAKWVSLDSDLLMYNNKFLALVNDTTVSTTKIHAYWNSVDLDTSWQNLIHFIENDVHRQHIYPLNNQIVMALNDYSNEKNERRKEELRAKIKQAITEALPPLNATFNLLQFKIAEFDKKMD